VPTDYASGVRSPLQGLTFNTADEMEAFVRALGGAVARGELNLNDYRAIKDDINNRYASWQERNPVSGLVLEGGGALAPGIVAAFVPGGQGVTAASAARVGGLTARAAPRIAKVAEAMAEPITLAAKRYRPALAVKRPKSLAVADELGTGVVQSAGAADTWRDIPRQVAEDLGLNAAFSGAVRGGNEALKVARKWWKGSR
jgi:hypothetical protein